MDTSNGSASHKMNGKPSLNGSMNGRAVGPRTRAVRKSPGIFARTFNIAARLLSWYTIISILFRCPPTLDLCDETSPRVCKPYFQIKHAVSPHLEPYYDAYAAPYIELVKPYYEAADRTVLTPTRNYAVKYGAPRVAQAQEFCQAQWQKTVHPQVARYQAVVKSKYDEQLAPHIHKVSGAVSPYYEIARNNALQTYHEILLPTYQFLEPHALQGYSAASAFTTGTAIPTAVWAWNKTYVFLDGTLWPQLRILYVESVEPQLVKIGQRLGRHNGSTTQRPALVSTAAIPSSKAASSFTKPSSSISASLSTNMATPSSSPESVPTVDTTSEAAEPEPELGPESEPVETPKPLLAEPVVGSSPEEGESDERRIARETVAEDLQAWQDKYANAADEGATEIEQRVEEISKRMIRRQARVTGKSIVQQLQQTVVAELVQLRRDILQLVASVQTGSATPAEAEERAIVAVRRAGMSIKQKAQAVRDWHQHYERELHDSVTEAASSHFTILGGIRDLALQKIGMKWAWMDGVTYKDWAKYHQLKDRFNEWEKDLEQLIVSHPALADAQEIGQTLEDEGMAIAQSAAKELARLKDVAAWKIVALDGSDEFDSDATAALAAKAKAVKAAPSNEPDIVEELLETVGQPAGEPTSEPPSTASESSSSEESASSSVSEDTGSVVETPESVVESADHASDAANNPTEGHANIVSEPDQDSSATEPTAAPEEPIILETPDNLDQTPITMENQIEDAQQEPAPVGLPVEEVVSEEEEVSDDHAEAQDVEDIPEHPEFASTTIKSVLFGAAAESAPSRKPVIDDDAYDSAAVLMASIQTELPNSISSMASSAYSAAVSRAGEQYSQAVSVVSAQIKGKTQPAHREMLASVSSAYSQATESASSKLDDALKAAADFYGSATARILVRSTPTPTPLVDWARVESIAAERLSQGQAWAADQYESAKIAVGIATPTPTSPVDKLLENARYNYYAGLGVAHARYSEFISAASSALSSMTATPTPTDAAGTLSSVASVASESAASVASVVGDNVSSAASVVGENVSSAASVVGENVSSAAAAGYENVASVAAAAGDTVAANWDALVDRLSVQVYGEPTPTAWYESLAGAAGRYAASATDAVGGGASSVTSAAGVYAAVASANAAGQYAAVSSIVSELLVGKEPSFSESIYSRLSAAYSTGAASAANIASAASDAAASAASEASEAVMSAGEKVASVASEATEAVKEKVSYTRDEL